MLVILARLSKCITRAEIIQFGKHNLKRFQSMGFLRNGVPSEPTLSRVFNGIDDEMLAGYMAHFTESFRIARRHWSIECLHWELDRNLKQDCIKRKTERSARNLDTIQRIVLNVISIWKNRRKKVSDKKKGVAELVRNISANFTRLLQFLRQK